MVITSKVHVQYDPTFFWEFLDNFDFWAWLARFQGLTRDTRTRRLDSFPESELTQREKVLLTQNFIVLYLMQNGFAFYLGAILW